MRAPPLEKDPLQPEAAGEQEQPPAEGGHDQPLPLDFVSPQYTLRAVVTGMLLGGVLSMCNVYAGLKIGWGFNMSITAALLGYGFWMSAHAVSAGRVRKFGILENNINQTACSAGASVSSAGLVAPIPALAMITGEPTIAWHLLSLWCFSVMMVGITVAIAIRRQMLIVDKLPFAFGIASAETLKEMYARGSEAVARVMTLLTAGVAAMLVKFGERFVDVWKAVGIPGSVGGFKLEALTFRVDPSLLFYGVGALIGFRACLSLLLGAVLAFGFLAPRLMNGELIPIVVPHTLPVLPADLALDGRPDAPLQYNEGRRRLEWTGVMSPETRDELLAASDDPFYQAAVGKLFVDSQLALETPLEAPMFAPAMLPEMFTIDEERGALRVLGVVPPDAVEELPSATGPEVRAAVERLAAYFERPTIAAIRFTTPLKSMPEKFHTPRRVGAIVSFDQANGNLTLSGCDPDTRRTLEAEMLQEIDEFIAEVERLGPEAARSWPWWLGWLETLVLGSPIDRAEKMESDAAALRAAFITLIGRSEQTNLACVDVPAELTNLLTYDQSAQTVTLARVLSKAELKIVDEWAELLDDARIPAAARALQATYKYEGPKPGFNDMVTWLLWPGVTLMVISALVSFSFSWRSVVAAMGRFGGGSAGAAQADTGEVTRGLFIAALVVALIVSVMLQYSFFAIAVWAATLGVLLSFVLALVAARVSGETSITPVGAMGKVTQLLFGALIPGNPAPNLMTANVTGGAASQCADLLHDLKCGYLIGALPRLQTLAQIWGALAGALAGSAIYLVLVPRPSEQLLTTEWPAPAVAQWKAVAELFMVGFEALPQGVPLAMGIAAVFGVLLPVAEKLVPKKAKILIPSAASVGLAFVVPANFSVTMFLGGAVGLLVSNVFKSWSARFLTVVCAGLIAGDTLTGVGFGIFDLFK